jgi:uncharacterized membrane protein
VDFSFTITNTGNTTLHDIGVSDIDGVVQITGSQIASLAPGATDNTTFAGSYVLTSTDISAGFHDNTAVAISNEVSVPSTVHVVLDHLLIV